MPFEENLIRFIDVLVLDAVEHLTEDAANAPDINGRVILFAEKDDLWWSVPT